MAGCHEPVRGLLGERLGEEKALRVFASERCQLPQLADGLHALGHDFDAEVVGERDDRLRRCSQCSSLESSVATNERSIFSESIGKRDEIGERRIAGAEVVDAELDAELLHALEANRAALAFDHARSR